MKKKWGRWGIVLAVSIGLLAGCGSNTKEAEKISREKVSEDKKDIYVFIAASLKNTMEEIQTVYEKKHPDVNIIYNADSSGTLQTQIEEGARCDIFFSAAPKQMDALDKGGYVVEGTVTDLLENQLVLIKPYAEETSVTGFENVTEASSIALAGEDVPVGQYARELFKNLGILDQVMAMEINEGANVTAILTAVAEGSNEVGIVYATDAASMPEQVEVLAKAGSDLVEPAVYPVGRIYDEEAEPSQTKAAEDFLTYLVEDPVPMELLIAAGFQPCTK
ncbi:MAG: molybdate ABC transporter substrate-binding protein [Blautia sp.]|jgi:molybdate transport system substrate-binding protein